MLISSFLIREKPKSSPRLNLEKRPSLTSAWYCRGWRPTWRNSIPAFFWPWWTWMLKVRSSYTISATWLHSFLLRTMRSATRLGLSSRFSRDSGPAPPQLGSMVCERGGREAEKTALSSSAGNLSKWQVPSAGGIEAMLLHCTCKRRGLRVPGTSTHSTSPISLRTISTSSVALTFCISKRRTVCA